MMGRCKVYYNWKMLTYLILSALMSTKYNKNENEPATHDLNTSIHSLNGPHYSTSNDKSPAAYERALKSFNLTLSQLYNLIISSFNNVIDSLKLFCCPGYGCLHVHSDFFITKRQLTSSQKIRDEIMDPFHLSCHAFNGKY